MPPAPPPKSRRTIGIVAVVAIVVVVILVVALSLSHSGGGSGATYGTATSYETALPAASSTASSAADGPWSLEGAVGVAEPVSQVLATGSSSSGCTITSSSGGTPPATVSLPGTSANLSSGLASSWFLIYGDSAGDILLVAIASGASEGGFIESGPDCSSLAGSDLAPLPGGLMDSPAAASIAWSSGVSGFAASNPSATSVEIILVNAVTSTSYVFEYSPCVFGASGTPTSQTEYTIGVNATTGAITVPGSSDTVDCVT